MIKPYLRRLGNGIRGFAQHAVIRIKDIAYVSRADGAGKDYRHQQGAPVQFGKILKNPDSRVGAVLKASPELGIKRSGIVHKGFSWAHASCGGEHGAGKIAHHVLNGGIFRLPVEERYIETKI